MVTETDLALDDGRTLHVYDTGDGAAGLTVFWHHGTPNTGAPPEPLFAASAERGIRWISHDRPGYGGSTPHARPGMTSSGAAELRAAATGRAALEAYLTSAAFDPEMFTSADNTTLSGAWSWIGTVADQALATDQGGMVDDDLAYVTPWGCDLGQVSTPVLFVHGAQDWINPSSHAIWLARRCRPAELWLRPGDGHLSILNSSVMALDWLREHASHR